MAVQSTRDTACAAGASAGLSYLYGDDVARTVDHGEPFVHEQLPHVLHVPLVGPAQHLALGALQDADRLQRSGQDHWRQGSGEDEAGCVGANCVHQGGAAGNISSHTAKSFTCVREYLVMGSI